MSRTGLKFLGAATAVAFTLIGSTAADASAATVQWNPQNTVEATTLASGSQLVIHDNAGNSVTCDVTTANLRAPIGGNPAVAGTVDSAGNAAAPKISNCTNTLLPGDTTTVTATGQWLATATSTSTVDVSQASATVDIGGVCKVTVSNAAVGGNAWDNNTHQVTANSKTSFPISQSGLCDGATSATLGGALQLPSEVTIS